MPPLAGKLASALTAAVAVLAVAPASYFVGRAVAAPVTDIATLSSTGAKGNGDAVTPSISADGRWVAWPDSATNLVSPPSNGVGSIFLRDRERGETRQVSLGLGGAQPDSYSGLPKLSSDGRFIVFYGNATNLAPSPGGLQVYLWSRDDGTIRRLSTNVSSSSTYTGVNDVDISDDGRRVVYTAFTSGARDDVFLVDVASGAVRRLAETSPGVQANGDVINPALSGDGKWVAYSTAATGLVPGNTDSNGVYDIVRENVDTGVRQRVSITSDNGEPNAGSQFPSLSTDGCVIAFASSATNLAAGASLVGTKTFVRDVCGNTTEAVSISNSNVVGTTSGAPSISGDGCVIAFLTSGIVVPAPTARAMGVRDRCEGVTSRVDVSTAGEPGNAAVTPGHFELAGRKGRYVTFSSAATNLVPNDSSSDLDAFVRDRGNNVAPEAAFSVAQAANRVTVDARGSHDPDGYKLTGSVSFGDGTPEATGLLLVHDYPRAGTYTVALTVTDADGATARTYQLVTVADPPPVAVPPGGGGGGGGAGGGGGGGTFDGGTTAALKLGGVKLSRSRFAAAPASGKPSGQQGATLSLTLSDAATLTLTFDRRASGRRKGGKCVAGGRRGTPCKTYKKAGSLTKSVKAGNATIALSGRAGGSALRTGTYRLTIAAKASDGRTAKTTVTFTVISGRTR
jgi:Tol biopolymer transport system component